MVGVKLIPHLHSHPKKKKKIIETKNKETGQNSTEGLLNLPKLLRLKNRNVFVENVYMHTVKSSFVR